MNAFFKRIAMILLALFLLLSSMSPASAGFSGLDASLSKWLQKEDSLRFSASIELGSLLPFTTEQVGMMNGLLQHLSLQASLEQDEQDSLTALALDIGGEQLFSLTERKTDAAYALTTSLLPMRVLTSKSTSPIDILGGTKSQGEPEVSFDMLSAISEAESCYQQLVGACDTYAEKKKIGYKIKDIGTARWVHLARLTTEQSDEMLPLLRAVLKSGMDEAHRAELDQVRFGKGFTVALYKLGQDDKDIALYMKGNLIYPDDSIRKLTYQWAFLNKGTERKDTYKYELVKSDRPTESRVVSALYSQKLFSDQLSIQGTRSLTTKKGGVTTVQTEKTTLSGKESGEKRTLEGSLFQQAKVTQGEKTKTYATTLTPDLILTATGEGAILSGAVSLENKEDKTILSDMRFSFSTDVPDSFTTAAAEISLYSVAAEPDLRAGSASVSILQNAEEDPLLGGDGSSSPGAAQDSEGFLVGGAPTGIQSHIVPTQSTTVSLDNISEGALASLLDELSQHLVGTLLLSAKNLPSEDLALLKDGMTDEDYASFLLLLGV